MGLFTFKYREEESELEKALQGIPFNEEIKLDYATVNDKTQETKSVTSSIYLLPVDMHGGVVYGYFLVDGKLAEAPIGFLQRRTFLLKNYFKPCLEGNLVTESAESKETVYLPLKLTTIMQGTGSEKDGKWISSEGSPYPLFGVEGSQGIRPLILVSETEEGWVCKGLYRNKNQPILYNPITKPQEQQIRNFLRTLKGVKPIFSEKKVMVETAQIVGTEKVPESTKYLEGISNDKINWEEPRSIVAYLDQYVIGQKDAKMTIAVAFSNYMTKVRTQNEELQKENLLLMGPSGVGKTYLISLLAKQASLPMVQTKLVGKSASGYKDESLVTVFERMRSLTKGEAPYGIIFFDEIDKLARDQWGSGSGFGSRLQDELIGWLEEATVLADAKTEKKEYNGFTTRNILFVTAGAFQGLSEDDSLTGIIQKRLGKMEQKQIGFGVQQEIHTESEEYPLSKVRPEDLIVYGLKPELVGRLPSLGVLHPLTVEDKVKILTATKRSSMTNYKLLLSLKGYSVEVDPSVLEVIAQHCPEETGARALHAVCNDLFTEILFDPQQYADDNKVIRVTPDLARKLINLYA